MHLEPILVKARAGAEINLTLNAGNRLDRETAYRIVLAGEKKTPAQTWNLKVAPGATARRPVQLRLEKTLLPGRHILPLRVETDGTLDGVEAFAVVEVE